MFNYRAHYFHFYRTINMITMYTVSYTKMQTWTDDRVSIN